MEDAESEVVVELTVTKGMIDAGVIEFWRADHGALTGVEIRDLVAGIYRAMHAASK